MFDFPYMVSVFPRLLHYVYLTLSITMISFVIGLTLGLLLEASIRSKTKIVTPLAKFYIVFFRSTPLLVQLFILYYGLPQVIPQLSVLNAFEATVIGISLNSAAYLAEIIRGAIDSVDPDQLDACLSVGLNKWQGMRRVIIPQAARVALPSLGNMFVTIIKETSLGFTLGLTEIMAQAKLMAADSFKYFECFLAVAIVYFGIALFFGYAQGKLEKRMNKPYSQEVSL